MGVLKLSQIINSTVENKYITNYSGKILLIDGYNLLNRYIIGIRNNGDDMKTSSGKSKSHLYAIYKFSVYLRKLNIYPIFIFDGKPSILKKDTLKKRKLEKIEAEKEYKLALQQKNTKESIKYFKRCVKISLQEIIECKELLDAMGIQYIQSIGEADSQCGALMMYYKEKIAGVISDDSDLILHGCDNVLKEFSIRKNTTLEVKLDKIIDYLNFKLEEVKEKNPHLKCKKFTREKLIELSVLLGTDYNKNNNLSNISPEKIFEYYVLNECNIKKLISYLKNKNQVSIDKFDSYKEIIEEYKTASVINPQLIELKSKKPNAQNIKKILRNAEFSEKFINNGINYLLASQKYYNKLYNT